MIPHHLDTGLKEQLYFLLHIFSAGVSVWWWLAVSERDNTNRLYVIQQSVPSFFKTVKDILPFPSKINI